MSQKENAEEKSEFYDGEIAITHDQRLPLILVVDTSSSMAGERIRELNKGLKLYKQNVEDDVTASNAVETAIVSFNSQVSVVQDFSLISEVDMPDLIANGATHLVEGVNEAISRVEDRKKWYKSQGLTYFRPFIILMTDGGPNGPGDISQLKDDINKGVEGKHFRFWAFGVKEANMELLNHISHPEFPPQKLDGLKFKEFFQWLSASVKIHSKSKPGEKVDISPANTVGEENNPFQLIA